MDASPDRDDTAHERDEFDPTSLGPDTPTIGEASDPAPGEAVEIDTEAVDEVLLRTFWGSVISLNVAMAAIPLGLLLIYFRGNWELGGLAVAIGCVAAVATVRFYRIFKADRSEEGEPSP